MWHIQEILSEEEKSWTNFIPLTYSVHYEIISYYRHLIPEISIWCRENLIGKWVIRMIPYAEYQNVVIAFQEEKDMIYFKLRWI